MFSKALLAGPEDAAEYGEDVIDPGSRVLPDMTLDNPGAHLFILTTTKVKAVMLGGGAAGRQGRREGSSCQARRQSVQEVGRRASLPG
ncbi:hypothetical protein E2C01_006479 [Portunus trituberculatus]|uniref:Uncharacterized protein n=1 Tax=Portunus trituberculatus TaxID=210409 RepID=A0A5B7CXG6_PORTR|nr:hypothetical protein [Portunus trituberculatus]